MSEKFIFSLSLYRIVYAFILSMKTIFFLKSIHHLHIVVSEPLSLISPLKKLFWSQTVMFNLTSLLPNIVSWNEATQNTFKYRFLLELMEHISCSLFMLILLTSIFTINIIVKECENKTRPIVDWNNIKKSFFCLLCIMPLGLHWPIYHFIQFLNRFYLYRDEDNSEGASTIMAYYTHRTYIQTFQKYYSLYGILSFLIMICLIKMLAVVIIKITKIVKNINISKAVKKHKIKEWRLFVIIFLAICLLNAYIAIANFVGSFELKDSPFTFWVADILDQNEPKFLRNNPLYEGKSVGIFDLLSNAIAIISGGILTFLIPFRLTKKKKYK